MQKYGEEILARYKLDDLSNVESEEISADKKDFDEMVMEIKRFDYETKVKARSERWNLQTASQLCTKQVGTREINQIIESLLKVNVQEITKTY